MFELAWSKLLEFWGGFLTHASALLPPTNSIAAGISFALIAAVILVPIMSRVGLGTMIGYLLAGIVVGPYGLGLVEEVETIMNFAEFGIVLMMFLIGLELDPKRLWEMKLPAPKPITRMESSKIQYPLRDAAKSVGRVFRAENLSTVMILCPVGLAADSKKAQGSRPCAFQLRPGRCREILRPRYGQRISTFLSILSERARPTGQASAYF